MTEFCDKSVLNIFASQNYLVIYLFFFFFFSLLCFLFIYLFFLQALSVGIFPYVLKLLQSSARELRPLLVFIWAKILAVDSVSDRLF